MKFLDLFAGVGGFRLGMEAAGHECIGFCEIDKFARKSYQAIFDTRNEVEMHDITTISDEFIKRLGPIDILCGGFPCQAFSIAGKRRGFSDTRGTLFFEIARFASLLHPRILFLENVKGLLSHKRGATFETIIRTLDELGYDLQWQVLNSRHYVPQNRERIFIIGYLRGTGAPQIFPLTGNDQSTTPIHRSKQLEPSQKKKHSTKLLIKEGTTLGYSEAEPGDSINISYLNSTERRGRVGKQIASTLLTGESQVVVTSDCRIRRLTPRECWRLQGFPDWVFDKARCVNSDTQLYKQAGNSVTVPVIYAIAKQLI
ncbi:DNA cytosine methyltransferase [Enterococcus faecalis]|uniref:DNA cytosine methyltransferase n=1 Tax=Enterococcus faecalis TaxID=1351 RepID=UPI00139DFF3E|nr:DNA cytosine methyltransferase [Enterococcus faecalis]EGO6562249.1 DNA cytosine methyltransferase [Enterococcus faecalis]EGO7560206.1 DNA cytosine methyltransferase [Enterococcus faecalis]EGO7742204.1 DNA cytosine methyltransferase [Enterococcus faecalis]EGO8387384.1 DNA cytosine methyltransferase [Enterococcus faecalis]